MVRTKQNKIKLPHIERQRSQLATKRAQSSLEISSSQSQSSGGGSQPSTSSGEATGDVMKVGRQKPGELNHKQKSITKFLQFHNISGVVAIQEIRYMQNTTKPCILKAPFSRLVREVARQIVGELRVAKVTNMKPEELRFQAQAIGALQVRLKS